MFPLSNADKLREPFAFATVPVFSGINRLLAYCPSKRSPEAINLLGSTQQILNSPISKAHKSFSYKLYWLTDFFLARHIGVHIFAPKERLCSFKFRTQSSRLRPTERTNTSVRFGTVSVENRIGEKNGTGTVNL
jgi:hypothetical protein